MPLSSCSPYTNAFKFKPAPFGVNFSHNIDGNGLSGNALKIYNLLKDKVDDPEELLQQLKDGESLKFDFNFPNTVDNLRILEVINAMNRIMNIKSKVPKGGKEFGNSDN